MSTATTARAPPPAPSTTALRGHLPFTRGRIDSSPARTPSSIGVVAAQALVDAGEDVDRAADARVVAEPVRQRGSLLLVRRRDERAGEVVAGPDLVQRIGQLVRPRLPLLDLDRRSGLGQRRAQHPSVGCRAERVADDRKAGCRHRGTLLDGLGAIVEPGTARSSGARAPCYHRPRPRRGRIVA